MCGFVRNSAASISKISSKNDLINYFREILPEYDEDRVYVSDIKKIIQWYNLLQKHEMLDALEEAKQDISEEEE